MKRINFLIIIIVFLFSFCSCTNQLQQSQNDKRLTVSDCVAARFEKSDDEKTLIITSEIDLLDTFDGLAITLSQEEVPLLEEWIYRITFNPSDLVKNSSEITIQFGENCISINDKIYVAEDGVNYKDILEWAENKYLYFEKYEY